MHNTKTKTHKIHPPTKNKPPTKQASKQANNKTHQIKPEQHKSRHTNVHPHRDTDKYTHTNTGTHTHTHPHTHTDTDTDTDPDLDADKDTDTHTHTLVHQSSLPRWMLFVLIMYIVISHLE